jgi:hypothetical protein
MFGRRCRLLAVGTMGTVLIQLDTGERVTTARRALRRMSVSKDVTDRS